MDNRNHVGIAVTPALWDFVRQLIIFGLGIALIIYAVTTTGHDATFILAGLILIGIVPIERLVAIRAANGTSPDRP
jgi:hypothetical protein